MKLTVYYANKMDPSLKGFSYQVITIQNSIRLLYVVTGDKCLSLVCKRYYLQCGILFKMAVSVGALMFVIRTSIACVCMDICIPFCF